MTEFLIWWTNQNDCDRITPLDSWPTWLYDEFQRRRGRPGRGRLWIASRFENDAPNAVPAWNPENWLCFAAEDAGGIVIPVEALHHVQFLPGFVTTFDMALPSELTKPS